MPLPKIALPLSRFFGKTRGDCPASKFPIKKNFFYCKSKNIFHLRRKKKENSEAGKIFSSDNKKKSFFPDVNVQPTELYPQIRRLFAIFTSIFFFLLFLEDLRQLYGIPLVVFAKQLLFVLSLNLTSQIQGQRHN